MGFNTSDGARAGVIHARLRQTLPALAWLAVVACATTSDSGAPEALAELAHPTWLQDIPSRDTLGVVAAAHATRGRLALAAGDGGAAADAFRQALATADGADGAPGLRAELAMALRLTGEHQEGLRLVPPGAKSLRAGVVRANLLIATGDVGAAWRLARSLAARHPLVLDTHYVLGRALLARHKRLEAQDAFDEVRLHAPDHRGAQLGALAAMSASPQHPDYKQLERQLLARWPADADLQVIVGAARETAGLPGEALNAYRRAVTASPRHPTANFNLARLIEERQGLGAARPYYERFIQSAPGARRKLAERLRRRLDTTPN